METGDGGSLFRGSHSTGAVPSTGKASPNALGETAVRYTYDDGIGEIGIIAPVSQAFCGQCNRIRLTSDGKIRTCLFSQFDHDLYGVMRRGGSASAR